MANKLLKPNLKTINEIKATDKEQWLPMGGGCYLVVAKSPSKSKRFVGATTIGNPKNKTYKVPLGVWGKDIKHPQDALDKWNEMKKWGKENNKDIRDYYQKNNSSKSTKTIKEIFDLFREQKETEVRDITTIKNRLNHN